MSAGDFHMWMRPYWGDRPETISHGVLTYRDPYADWPPAKFDTRAAVGKMRPIPEGAMRVAPGSDAVVWRINSDSCGEL